MTFKQVKVLIVTMVDERKNGFIFNGTMKYLRQNTFVSVI